MKINLKSIVPVTIGAGLFLLTACNTQPQQDINAVLGSGVASTALSYVAALDPTIQKYIGQVDAVIAADAPKVLSVACGGLSMANFVLTTTEMLDAKLIAPSMQQELAAGFAVTATVCPPAAPPANIAQAAQRALALYQAMMQALAGAGVKTSL